VPILYDWSVTLNTVPLTPSLDSPADTATGISRLTVLKTTTTDPDSDNLKYKILLCTDSGMTTNCKTFDQTSSQTGWSGQNADTNTTYTSGTQATYTIQAADILNSNTVYYWKSYAIDQGTYWSSTQSTPYSFTTNKPPNTPSLDLPVDAAISVIPLPTFKTTATDDNAGDNLKYKIHLCTNSAMTAGCKTFDQTSNQTGWSGQNADTNTTYTSGTQASFTVQTAEKLSPNTVYYWKSYAIDEAGSNTWSPTQTNPYSFTTKAPSAMPAPCTVSKSFDNTSITVNWTDSSHEDNYQVWKITDGGLPVQLGSNLAPDTIQLVDSAVVRNHSYGYLIRGLRYDASITMYSTFCSTSSIHLPATNNSLLVN
jgi:hypothetical protein